MGHALIRSTLLTQIIPMIQDKYKVNENTALKIFYSTALGELFSDDEMGFYGDSAIYLFSIFEDQYNNILTN